MQQLSLTFSKTHRGGVREGAGRKRSRLSHTPHRARAKHQAAHPVHVTLRASLRSLRNQQLARTVLGALRDSRRKHFRVTHYSIQDNHIHLLVEAQDKLTLSSAFTRLDDPCRPPHQQTPVPSRFLLGRSLARPRPKDPA